MKETETDTFSNELYSQIFFPSDIVLLALCMESIDLIFSSISFPCLYVCRERLLRQNILMFSTAFVIHSVTFHLLVLVCLMYVWTQGKSVITMSVYTHMKGMPIDFQNAHPDTKLCTSISVSSWDMAWQTEKRDHKVYLCNRSTKTIEALSMRIISEHLFGRELCVPVN